MADYIINRTDPLNGSFIIKPMTTNGPASPAAAVPLDSQAVTANTSIVLLGQGMFQYGERVAESFVHMLENFAGPTAPAYPIQGQLWFDNGPPFALSVYDGATWQPIVIGSFPIVGDLDMGGFKIINLGNPTAAGDALNLGFADTRYVNITGDIMTGALTTTALTISGGNIVLTGAGQITLPNAPTLGTHGVNKNYVDTRTLDNLSDVIITAPAINDYLSYNGVNWINATAAVNTFLSLTDTPASYAGFGGFTVRVNAGETGLEFSTAPVSLAFTDLTDVPTSYVGQAGLFVRVRADEAALEFVSFSHTHLADQVFVNTNPVSDDSRIREVLYPTSTFAENDLQTVINAIDEDLYQLRYRNQRFIIDGVSYAIDSADNTVSPDEFTIAGDFTELFFTGYAFEVIGSAGNDGTYICVANATFAAGFTTIYVTDGSISVNEGAGTGTGDIYLLTYDLQLEYRIEKNKLMVFNNGVKYYANERGYGDAIIEIVTPPVAPYTEDGPNVNIADWSGLPPGTWDFSVAVDGGVAQPISIVVPALPYTITAVTTGVGGTWTITGNFVSLFTSVTNRTMLVFGNTGLGVPVTYTIFEATLSGGNTVIQVHPNETIDASANASGSLDFTGLEPPTLVTQHQYTFQDLVDDINSQVTDAVCRFDDSVLAFFSDTTGTGSQILLTDTDLLTTMNANLPIATTIVFDNNPAVSRELGYAEPGRAYDLGTTIELTDPLMVGDIAEISLMR